MVPNRAKHHICEKFTDYFEINAHQKSTRNRNLLLQVPKARLQIVKQGLYYQGAELSNYRIEAC